MYTKSIFRAAVVTSNIKKKQMFINSKMDNLWHIHMWMKMK